MKTMRYIIEAIFVTIFFAFLKMLSPHTASNIGGWLGRTIGPGLSVNRKAARHLKIAFPDINEEQSNVVLKNMWDNLGRIFAEYPHLEKISRNYTLIENKEILEPFIRNKQPVIFIGGHIGNWEINCPAMLTQLGQSMTLTYRAPNNPWVEKLLATARNINGKIKALPKSRASAKALMQTLKSGEFLGILIDQKYNEGVNVDFFGAPAMTNPVFVQLAQKYNCPVIPVQCKRLNGCAFKLTIHPPIQTQESGTKFPVEDVVHNAHTLLEQWITESPEQWVWLHRRWKS